MKAVTVVTTHIVKSPEIFDSQEFIQDLITFKQDIFLAQGCLSVEILKDLLEPCKKFFLISHWSSIDALAPFVNAKYSRRMSLFKKKYLSLLDVTVTRDLFPKMESWDLKDQKMQQKKSTLPSSANSKEEVSLEAY